MSYSTGIISAGGVSGLKPFGTHGYESIEKERARTNHTTGYDTHENIDFVAAAGINKELSFARRSRSVT
jgi:hypothetical protein